MRNHVLAAAGVAVVATFSANALVLAGPTTPITFDVGPIASLLNPHLSQNWQLFAPDPISDERGVVARLRCDGKETGWKDISSKAIARAQGSRFFPDRESRIVSNALVERSAEDDITRRLEARGKKDLVPPDTAETHRAERVLARYAASQVACPAESAGRLSAVQLRYVVRSLPPWSERSDGSDRPEPRVMDSRWIPL